MKIAACLIVKDEARDIPEWLSYQLVIGFDTVLIYDNGSTDGTLDIIRAAATLLDVRLTEWSRTDTRSQMDAYEDASRRWAGEFDWIAFFDVDEFLVLHGSRTLCAFLDRPADVSAVAINWAIFGSAGHVDFPTGLVTETFTRRGPASLFVNRHVKCFVRPASLQSCLNPHYFETSGRTVDAEGRTMEWFYVAAGDYFERGLSASEPDYGLCQLNHYFLRSKAHWARKVARGYPSDIHVRKMEEFDQYDRNEIEDETAAQHTASVIALRAKIRDRETVGSST